MRIREEGIGNARSRVGHTAFWWHCRSADNPTLILYIEVIPEAAIQGLWLSEIIVAQTQSQHDVTPYFPLILSIACPRGILEFHRAAMQDRKLSGEAVGKTEERGRQR